MAQYKSFVHVLRLNRPEVQGYLCGKIYVSIKMDGTSAVVYCGDDGKIHYGSRKREITPENDNAGFAAYCEFSNDDKIAALKQFILDNPNLIIFGEWLAGVDGRKFTGAIKTYLTGGLYIFAVFDIDAERYLTHDEWVPMLDGVYDKLMKPIAVLDNPTEDEIAALLDQTGYDLPPDTLGEGIVLYNFDFRDNYGHPQVCKLVREDFLNSKSRKSKANEAKAAGETEREFVEEFCTISEISKAQAKVMVAMGVDEWTNDKALIGRTMNEVVTSVIEDNLVDFVLKKKMKVDISFGNVRNLINQKVRDYLGL